MSATDTFDVVIVGGGHAGAQAAIALRQRKFEGSILIVGEEPDPPYERPPLSKDYLSGEKDFDRILLRPVEFWTERRIGLRLGHRVVSVDALAKRILCDDGQAIHYGNLVWAAGGHARRLTCDGHDLSGVHTVRSRADVDQMMVELEQVHSVVVVGGGFIGLEAAAVLAKQGKIVTVLEAADRVLARVACAEVSRFYEQEHRLHGVTLRLDVQVEGIDGEAGRATGVRLAGGERIAADMVIVGIGIVPSVEPLLAAGAGGGAGVHVDAFCRTSLEAVFAVGDCASHDNPFGPEGAIRLESVQNANDQAGVAAKAITGEPEVYRSVPWFWSNQYDLRLQTVGLSAGYDAVVLRGDPQERSFSAVYLRQGKVIALDCINATKDYVQGRKLVVEGVTPDLERLKDSGIPLKEI